MNIRYILPLFAVLLFSSCFEEDDIMPNTKQGNFEALWKIMDERYCFFEYKDVDWDKIHAQYAKRISDKMSNDAFFDLLGEMLAEVKDGHVNLSSTFNVARYWNWYTDYPDNFDEKILRNGYIGTDYGIAGGMKYKLLENNIGYIHYASFNSPVGESNINQVLMRFMTCRGIILDVRDNGGGFLTYSERIASHFISEKTLVGYIQHKTGKGHNDLSKPYEIHIKPSDGVRYMGKVVLLTNRRCYSAANDFVNAMRYAPNVTSVGDKTGGGSGLPFSSELPNGWGVRFSASPMLDATMQQLEFGIEPDIRVDMTPEDMAKNKDTIIEEAIKIINND